MTHKNTFFFNNLTIKNLIGEVWVSVIGFEDKYQVSNLGRLKSLARLINGKGGSTYMSKPRILKQQSKDNKLMVWLMVDSKNYGFLVSRLVFFSFNKDVKMIPENLVMHIDNDTLNNFKENLKLGTHKEITKLTAINGKLDHLKTVNIGRYWCKNK